ncbi:MAG: GspH/FimT family pseudopilin [Nitrospirae bacterium]|nr:GspH/FimT family pseudopilin [Nitrospirota bacterium]
MRRRSSGFTLVEIMIVLLILGIVMSAAIPSMNSTLEGMKLDGAAQEVVYAIQYAQSVAIKEGTGHGVEFFPSEERFRCFNNVTDITVLNPFDKKDYDVTLGNQRHVQGVNLVDATFGNKEIIFNALGEPSESGSVVLGYRDFQKTISVAAPLGRITVQ